MIPVIKFGIDYLIIRQTSELGYLEGLRKVLFILLRTLVQYDSITVHTEDEA